MFTEDATWILQQTANNFVIPSTDAIPVWGMMLWQPKQLGCYSRLLIIFVKVTTDAPVNVSANAADVLFLVRK